MMDDLRGGTLALEHFYEVGEVLHHDMMGTTYHGTQSPQEKPISIWVLRKLTRLGDTEHIIHRFKLAAWRASRFNHPNHLALLDFGQLGADLPFVVFEHAPDSERLRDIIRERGPLDLPTTLEIVEQLAHALEAAHAEDLHHRGLETGRVRVLHLAERRPHALLVAPGIALEREDLLALEGAVVTSEQIRHLPPEVFTRDPDAPPHLVAFDDTLRDVYGLAAITYECLTGTHPYLRDHLDAADGILAMLHEQPLALPHFELPESLDAVLQQALSRNPNERFATPRDFLEAFRAAIPAELLEPRRRDARPGSTSRPHVPLSIRERLADPFTRGMFVVICLLVMVSAAAIAVVSSDAGPPPEPEPYYLPQAPPGEGVDVVIQVEPNPEQPLAPETLETVEVFRVFPDGETLLIGHAPLILRNQPAGERHRLVIVAPEMRAQNFEFEVRDQGNQLMLVQRLLNPDLTHASLD